MRRVVEELKKNKPAPVTISKIKEEDGILKLENNALHKNIESLKRQIEILTSSVEQGRVQNRMLSGELQKQATELAALRLRKVEDRESTALKNKRLEAELEGIKLNIDKLGREKEKLKEQLEDSRQAEQKLKENVDSLKQTTDQLTKTSSELQSKLNQ